MFSLVVQKLLSRFQTLNLGPVFSHRLFTFVSRVDINLMSRRCHADDTSALGDNNASLHIAACLGLEAQPLKQ